MYPVFMEFAAQQRIEELIKWLHREVQNFWGAKYYKVQTMLKGTFPS